MLVYSFTPQLTVLSALKNHLSMSSRILLTLLLSFNNILHIKHNCQCSLIAYSVYTRFLPIVQLQASDCGRPWTRTTFTPNTRLIIQLIKPSTPSFLVRINTPSAFILEYYQSYRVITSVKFIFIQFTNYLVLGPAILLSLRVFKQLLIF